MESAARLRKEETLPMIVDALENPLKRDDAVAALAKFEDKAVTLLKPMLGEEKTSLEVKRAVVAVLSQLSSHLSTETLLESLPDSEAGLTSAIIDALDKIRSEQPDVWFSPLQIEPKLLNLIKQQYKLLLQEEELDESEQKERQVLKKSMADKRSNIFKLMGLLYSHDDIMKAYQNIQTGTKKSVAYALELLDNTLQKELRDLIIPLVEEYPPDLRKKKYRQIINALE
jgi:AAA family ATP:ADP antiporter